MNQLMFWLLPSYFENVGFMATFALINNCMVCDVSIRIYHILYRVHWFQRRSAIFIFVRPTLFPSNQIYLKCFCLNEGFRGYSLKINRKCKTKA